MTAYKQHNKKAWTQDEMQKLFDLGKSKSSINDIKDAMKHRPVKSITNKLYHMGFNLKGGKVL